MSFDPCLIPIYSQRFTLSSPGYSTSGLLLRDNPRTFGGSFSGSEGLMAQVLGGFFSRMSPVTHSNMGPFGALKFIPQGRSCDQRIYAKSLIQILRPRYFPDSRLSLPQFHKTLRNLYKSISLQLRIPVQTHYSPISLESPCCASLKQSDS